MEQEAELVADSAAEPQPKAQKLTSSRQAAQSCSSHAPRTTQTPRAFSSPSAEAASIWFSTVTADDHVKMRFLPVSGDTSPELPWVLPFTFTSGPSSEYRARYTTMERERFASACKALHV